MDINQLIEQYGYAALLIGSLAEGETVTLLGGVAAHQGLLTFPWVVAAVALGGMIGDQVLFFIGRYFGDALLVKVERHQAKIEKARALIHRHPYLFVIGSRFMYGFRIVGPIIIGASRLSPKIFIPLNILGAVIWATLFTTLGYLGGEVIAPWLHEVDHHIKIIIGVLAALGVLIGLRLWLKYRKGSDNA